MIYDLDGMLPERAFRRDARGQIKPQAGGGGSKAPTSQNVTQTSIPEYARPYVEKTLGQTAALTDINQNPYQPYQGQRVAEFSPLQQQAMGSIAGQQTAPQLQAATQLATQSGQGGLQAFDTSGQLQSQALGYGAQGANLGILGGGLYGGQAAQAGGQYANMATSPGAVSQYMSPYMQNAVDVQKQEAIRDYQKTMPMLGAQAVRSGAFGGSRQAITEAEAQRNVNQQLANIQATGSQQAYDRAMQSMQFGSNLGLQGLQTGLQGVNTQLAGTGQGMQGVQGAVGAGQYGLSGLGTAGTAASTLGALGQTQFGQEMGINQAQMQAGALQQAQAQRGLDIPYQEYQEQLNYPYKQLAFQSDMFRGLPLSQSAQTIYQNTGAMAPQLLGAGIAAYGASTRAKNGGLIKGYAEGGTTTVDPSVPSSIGPQALSSRLAKLSDEQLMAYARTVKDAVALAEVQGEIQRRQEARAPQGQMPSGTVAQGIAPSEEAMAQPPMMAGGGIVALRNGGTGDQSEFSRDIEARKEAVKLEDERARVLKPLAKTAGPFGYFTTSPSDRAVARGTLAELQNAPIEDIRAYRDTGVVPRSEDPFGTPAQMAALEASNAQEAERRAELGRQAENLGSPVGYEDQAPAPRPSRGIDEMPEEGASAVTGTAPSSAPPGTVPGGIVPSRAPVAAAPAGQAPAGQAPAAPAGIVPSSKAPTAMAGGAVPIANPGDPMGWGAYKANVDDMAKLDPEQKAVLDDMRKRTERKMGRAEKQEKNVMSEAMIAGGLAMMGGLNLSDGVRRLAMGGGQKYFESSAAASKAIEAADDAQGAFDQYQLSLKQGNKKVAAEMYGKYYGTMMDFQGKIQSANISAGASMANAQAQREATDAYRAEQLAQRRQEFDINQTRLRNDMTLRVAELESRRDDSKAQNAVNAYRGFQDTINRTEAQKTAAINSALKPYTSQYETLSLAASNPKADAKTKQAFRTLQAQIDAARDKASKPFDLRILELETNSAKALGMSMLSGSSNIPTYDPKTDTWK